MDGVRVLPPSDRAAFASMRASMDAALDGVPLPAASAGVDAGAAKEEEAFEAAPDADGGAPEGGF